jgi:RNA polymerase sigma-70 factor (ECF subfamily)
MTRNDADAQDLMQDAFLHLFQKLDTFRGESGFYTWFHRMVVNLFLMQLRRKRRSVAMETPLADAVDPDSHSHNPSRGMAAPDGVLMGAIDRVTLQRALAELPSGYRMALVLHDIEGYGHGEISEMTACSRGTSKSQLHRARRRLRKLLAHRSRLRLIPIAAYAHQSYPQGNRVAVGNSDGANVG